MDTPNLIRENTKKEDELSESDSGGTQRKKMNKPESDSGECKETNK